MTADERPPSEEPQPPLVVRSEDPAPYATAAPPSTASQPEDAQKKPAGTRAILSLILGLLSTFASPCFPVGIPLGVAAVVLGWVELTAIGKDRASPGGRGFAIAGIVFGALGILVGLMSIVLCAFLWKLGTSPLFDEIRRGVPI